MNLQELETEIQNEYTLFLSTARTSLAHARRIGQLLNQAKSHVRHGEWLKWLDKHALCKRSASSFMKIAREWETILAKRNSNPFWTITDALRILCEEDTSNDDAADEEKEDDDAADDDGKKDDEKETTRKTTRKTTIHHPTSRPFR